MTAIHICNAMILDGTGAAPFAGDVLVDGNQIAAITPPGQTTRHPDARVVECNGATPMPGLTEPHAHLSFVDQATPFAFHTIPVEEHLLLTRKDAKLHLDHGFTSCFSAASTKPRLDIVARNAIDRGQLPGPRTRAANVQFTVTGGVGDLRQMHVDPGQAMYTRRCQRAVGANTCARS